MCAAGQVLPAARTGIFLRRSPPVSTVIPGRQPDTLVTVVSFEGLSFATEITRPNAVDIGLSDDIRPPATDARG
jgi:hypothetical protein